MPIYEYRCSSCGHELEALQKFSDAPLVTCPSCGAETLVKQVSAAGFQLKGSGWYVTDFRGGATKPGKTEGGASPEAAKGQEGSASGEAKDSKGDSTGKSDAISTGGSAGKSDGKPDTSGSSAPAAKSKTTTTST
jgi:putative FmdB family regulatory protein